MRAKESPLPVSNANQKRRIKEVLIECIIRQTKGGFAENLESVDAIANTLMEKAMNGLESYMGVSGSNVIGFNRSWAKLYQPSGIYRVIRLKHAKHGGILCLPAELVWNHPKLDAVGLDAAMKIAAQLVRKWPELKHGQEIQDFAGTLSA